MNLGRNEKCWCGSGNKYKKCHLDRDQQKPIDQSEAHRVANSSTSKKYCSVPDELKHECSRKIINAHTVSKGSSLLEIADDTNHVLGLKISLAALQRGNGTLSPERIGINQASTFKGFCSVHDKDLFSCIEDEEFSKKADQLFALAYRSLCKEVYVKGTNEDVVSLMKKSDKGKELLDQFFTQQLAADYGTGVNAAVQELGLLKNAFDRHLLKIESLNLCHLIVSSDEPCPVAVSSILCPDVDFEGNVIQNLSDLTVIPECIIFNSFSSDGKGFIVFSWLSGLKIIDGFVASLMNTDEGFFSAILRFFFSVSENIYISPTWWNSLTKVQRDNLTRRVMVGVNPFEPEESNYLCDDSVKFEGWNISSIEQLNF
ncbi:MAG: SEC-C domain-containing protein [Pseudomonadota bacterium]